jgi:L-lactate dehydrogenase (cytochrome)
MSRTRIVAPVTPADYRLLAERRLPRFLFDYADGGANDELTMAANAADFAGIRLRQRERECPLRFRRSASALSRRFAPPPPGHSGSSST